MENLREKITDLLYTNIQTSNIKENDDIKILKLFLVGNIMLDAMGLSWDYVKKLLNTHILVHPEHVNVMMSVGDEEITSALAQGFVSKDKLARIMKSLAQYKLNINQMLAVDGLAGNLNKEPNFEHKNYVANLRYGNKENEKTPFDVDPDFKRKHVQAVREMYNRLGNVPAPEKQIYEILRKSFEEMTNINLPEIEFKEFLNRKHEVVR